MIQMINCQCSVGDIPCERLATQEDLLCNLCRRCCKGGKLPHSVWRVVKDADDVWRPRKVS